MEKQLVAWEAGDTETLIQTTPSIFDLFTEGNAKKGAPFIDLRAGRDWLRASDPFVLFQHVAIKVQRLLKERNEGPNILLEAMLEALDNPSFLQQVEGKFKAIIVDEFQDTDPLQWAIFSKFKPDLLLCVGDPKQSIYAFRGANLATFWEAKHHFSHIYHLSNNYRSDPKLIETFNTLFNIQELSYIPIKAKRPSLSETPFHMVVGNQRYFFSYIAAHIQEGKKNAILVKDRYQAAAVTTYLEALNIPVASQATPNITKGKAFHVLKLGLPPEFSDEGDFADYRQRRRSIA